jgi:hypothetical protein
MKPTRGQNTKARMDLSCPGCGMDLSEGTGGGYVAENATYCCQGCAEGTGCTCVLPAVPVKRIHNRRGDRGQRNKANSLRDRNLGSFDTSGRRIARTRSGFPENDIRDVQPEVINPRRAHTPPAARAGTTRGARRRRKQVAKLAQPRRRQKQTGRPLVKQTRKAGYR